MKRLLFALGIMACAAPVLAQTPVINPTTLEFLVSQDHDATDLAGGALVTSYQFDAVGMTGQGALAITVGLGKPTPNGVGLVVLPLPQLATLTPNLIYTATVTALGPGGSGVSVPSPPFGRAVPTPPRAPGRPTLRP